MYMEGTAMARQWVYWALVYHRRFLNTGSANVELFIDPPAGLMAETALSAYQDGGGGCRIGSVNNTYGLADDYYFGDGVWRIEMNLKIVGGMDHSNLNVTRARMVVREYDDGTAWRMDNSSSAFKAFVYDRETGEILHTDEVIGPEDRLADMRAGKLEARAHDFVTAQGYGASRFSVLPMDSAKLGTLSDGTSLQVDPTVKELVVTERRPQLLASS
jgi:hypothetical protein